MKYKIPPKHVSLLKKLYKLFKDENIDWILAGSTALVMRGIDIEVHDLDIQVKKKDLKKITKLLDKYTTKELKYVQTDELNIRSYWGKYLIDGVELDIASEIAHKLNGKWKKINTKTATTYEFEGMKIKLLPLRVEYEGYLAMSRTEKANKILKALR